MRYSPSTISTYNQCPRKFKYQSIDKVIVPKLPSIETERGSLFHEVLEHDMQGNAIENFTTKLKFELLDPDRINKTYDEAKDFMSKSSFYAELKQLENIEIERSICLDRNLMPLDYALKETDQCLMSGRCDLMAFDKNILHVYDWKTGGKSRDKIRQYPKDTLQLDIYCVWGVNMFPIESSKIGYIYVDHNFPVVDFYKKNQIEKIRTKIFKNIETIESDKTYAPKYSRLCDWCDYKELCLTLGNKS